VIGMPKMLVNLKRARHFRATGESSDQFSRNQQRPKGGKCCWFCFFNKLFFFSSL